MNKERYPVSRNELFVGGVWHPARAGRDFAVINPASGREIVRVASADVEDVIAAVAAAQDALPVWARTAPRDRAEQLRRCFEILIDRRDSIATVICLENGKSWADALAEVDYAAEFFRWYGEEAVRLSGVWQTAPSGQNDIVVQRHPIGVALLVTPWNFPAAMAARKIAPALAAGCTVVLKPAEETPLTALVLCECMSEAGVPAGVVNVVPTDTPEPVVAAALSLPAVRKLSFTGSTEIGRQLLGVAATRVTSCSMELGGNAPFVVLADADVPSTVQGALIAKMRNGGQACTAANRFLVHASVADEFAARFASAMLSLSVGSALRRSCTDARSDVGPLINEAARKNVHRLVTDAVARGATLLTGGEPLPGPGYFYPPTVLDHVPASAHLLSQEIFGPVAPIVRFTALDAAVALANDTESGLAGYVYGTDAGAVLEVAEALEVGMVGVNRPIVSDPAAPFGGMKQSGLGREGGHEGVLEFTEQKYLAIARR